MMKTFSEGSAGRCYVIQEIFSKKNAYSTMMLLPVISAGTGRPI